MNRSMKSFFVSFLILSFFSLSINARTLTVKLDNHYKRGCTSEKILWRLWCDKNSFKNSRKDINGRYATVKGEVSLTTLKRLQFTIENFPDGLDCALTFHHDENGNGRLDMRRKKGIKMPLERSSISHYPNPLMFYPSWEVAKIGSGEDKIKMNFHEYFNSNKCHSN